MKAQGVRLLDVFVLGPLMIYAASKLPRKEDKAAAALGVTGVATIIYNGRNYLVKRRQQDAPEEL